MKYSRKAAGIIEAMIVLLLLTMAVTGVYTILLSSQKLSLSTSYRIEAIQIARDGLEAMTNIRDTNWIEFGGDARNCWNVNNYNDVCIGDTTKSWQNYIGHLSNQSLRIFRNSENKFATSRHDHTGAGNYSDTTFRNNFMVKKTPQGFYTQDALSSSVIPDRVYTRQIRITYLDNNGNPVATNQTNSPNSPMMDVTAIVQWQDPAVSETRRLEMTTRLTNWRDRN